MRDRREHQRFKLASRHAGALRYLSAVEVVTVNGGEIVVIADQAGAPGEELMFHGTPSPSAPVAVRISACHPVLVDGQVRFQMRLGVDDATRRAEAGA